MIRTRENPFVLKAGALSVLVHGLFFVLLVMTFSWKNVPPMQVAQVELWDSLPQPEVAAPEPRPEPPPPPKIEPQPEPPPPPEPKAEIQLKAKPPPPEVKKPPKEEPKKPDPALKAKEEEKKRKEALRKLQEDLLKDDQPVDHVAQQAEEAKAAAEARRAAETLASSSGVVDEYKARIVAKIKRYVNKQVCGAGKPELVFAIAMMPTGEVSGNPRLVKSSGLPACDQAVERAILQAVPLPLPPQSELFAQFRDLNLKFRPNDEQ
ncbi:MAG: protein tola [Methylophilales bacterium RIFCSPHIGHO2_02_FULL_57_10]|nr:MAG: protein tola [Methylophilales bacterium RIFCSPHIGHO2_02_FULL_57_10]